MDAILQGKRNVVKSETTVYGVVQNQLRCGSARDRRALPAYCPQGRKEMFVVTVNEETCVGCGECVEACPAQIFKLENGKAVASSDECLGCQGCVAVCTAEAIKVEEF